MGISISGLSNYSYQYTNQATPKTDAAVESSSTTESGSEQISAEQKLKQANEFWAAHDQLYAEQISTVMNTITDGMAVAQEIMRRMCSGAKVSQADEQNLMEYDPRMYMAAKNAQMMAQRKQDMSGESLIDEFEERHASDRKDWTSELEEKLSLMNLGPSQGDNFFADSSSGMTSDVEAKTNSSTVITHASSGKR